MNGDDPRETLVHWLINQGTTRDPPATSDLGLLGYVFGARYASSNIAGLVVVAALLLLIGDRFAASGHVASRELVTGAISLISLVLGYLFGARPWA